MGLLVPLEHATRVDPQRAARVFLALDRERVHASSIPLPDAAAIDFVCARLVPDTDTSVSVYNGQIALDELAAVMFAGGDTITCAGTTGVDLRVWPQHAVLYAGTTDKRTSEDREALFREFGTRLTPGPSGVSVSHPNRAALAHLPRLLIASGGRAEIVCAELPALVAAEIAERLPCDNFQCGDLMYEPETRILSTFFVNVIPPDEAAAWLAKIDAALMSR